MGQLTGREWADGRSVGYAYDGEGRLEVMTPSGGAAGVGAVSYDWDAAGNLTSVARGGGPISSFGYDAAGQLSTLVHSRGGLTVASHAVTRDAGGNPTRVVSSRPGVAVETTVMGYDARSQLTQVCRPTSGVVCGPGSPKSEYVYDLDGNRVRETTPRTGDGRNARLTHMFDAGGRLTSTRDARGALVNAQTWDVNGNLASKADGSGAVTEFDYRLDGELGAVSLPGGDELTYGYDPVGNRTSRSRDGVVEATWTWDTLEALGTRLSESGTGGVLVSERLPDPVSPGGAPLAETAGGVEWLLADPFGSVTDLVDAAGVVTTVRTDPFGDHVFRDGHKLEPLVEKFGSREGAMEEIVRNLDGPDLPADGTFEVERVIGGQSVTIRGKIVNGIARMGTAFTRRDK